MHFCLIDRVTEIHANEMVKGIRNLTVNDEVLLNHFPEYPIYPGTLVVEAAAQLSGFLLEYSLNQPDQPAKRAILVQIEKAKFHTPMIPGDQLEIMSEMTSVVGDAAKCSARVTVSDTQTASVDLQFKLFEAPNAEIHKQQREIYTQWTRRLELDRPIP